MKRNRVESRKKRVELHRAVEQTVIPRGLCSLPKRLPPTPDSSDHARLPHIHNQIWPRGRPIEIQSTAAGTGTKSWGSFAGFHRPPKAHLYLIELSHKLVLSFQYCYRSR